MSLITPLWLLLLRSIIGMTNGSSHQLHYRCTLNYNYFSIHQPSPQPTQQYLLLPVCTKDSILVSLLLAPQQHLPNQMKEAIMIKNISLLLKQSSAVLPLPHSFVRSCKSAKWECLAHWWRKGKAGRVYSASFNLFDRVTAAIASGSFGLTWSPSRIHSYMFATLFGINKSTSSSTSIFTKSWSTYSCQHPHLASFCKSLATAC